MWLLVGTTFVVMLLLLSSGLKDLLSLQNEKRQQLNAQEDISFDKILNVRPLLNKENLFSDASEIINKEYLRSGVRASFTWGLQAELNPDGVDRTGLLEYIDFSYDVSGAITDRLFLMKNVAVYGFNMGMPFKEAEKRFDEFQFKQYRHVKKYRYLIGVTPEPFEIHLRFILQDDGSEVLNLIRIAQPNHSKICEVRSAHNKKLFEEQKKAARRALRWQEIENDNDGMLMDWARHCKPWNDYSESQFIQYANWLMKASPNERHVAAQHWNWDYGEAPMIWICSQSDTDIATAITIFFLFEPSYYLKFAGDLEATDNQYERFILKHILEIQKRIEQGFYSNSSIYADFWQQIGSDKKYQDMFPENNHTYPKNIRQIYEGFDLQEAGVNIPDFGIE